MSVSVQDIQDQFDLWFPHGAIYQVDHGDQSNSFISPWIKVTGGTMTRPEIQVTGDPMEVGFNYQITSWDITQQDPLVLTFHAAEGPDLYQLGARVPESVYSDPEFQQYREQAMSGEWAAEQEAPGD